MLAALAACNSDGGTPGAGSAGSTSSGGGSAPQQPASGSAVLSWSAPTTNTNGTALTNLAGYTILYGTNPGALNQAIALNSASTNSYTINGLAAGTWYFSIVANSNDGTESSPTSPVSMTIS